MSEVNPSTAASIYDFSVADTYGNEVSLEKYRGHVVVIVNIASKCGLAGQYDGLMQLRQKYHEKGLRILAFPCNQFAGQMPEGDGAEMVCHLQKRNAEFGDLFAKIDVNGDTALPLYKYLKEKQGDEIEWNFCKFLVDKNGQAVKRFSPTTEPTDMASDIEKLL